MMFDTPGQLHFATYTKFWGVFLGGGSEVFLNEETTITQTKSDATKDNQNLREQIVSKNIQMLKEEERE